MVTKVYRYRNEILQALESCMPKTTLELIAFYNSKLDKIITDPLFMSVSITDALIEGWGVFDTLNIYNSVPYQLSAHIDRLFFSAEKSRIPMAFTKEIMSEKILEMIRLFPNSRIRFFISGSEIFYILMYNDISQDKPKTIEEVTVSVPPKPKILAEIKSTNYLSNALSLIEARSKSGYMGISLDDNQNLAESAIANIAVVYQNKFLTPMPEFILEGTTVKRVLEFCRKLVDSGELEDATRADINLEMAYQSQEMMMLGGDSVIAITKLDGIQITQGIGPITQKIFEFLAKDRISHNADFI
jgi:branched-subunit amino acid aminotransferase/4-amino-4-deoxychorismate lyase